MRLLPFIAAAALFATPAQAQVAPRLDARLAQAIVNGCAAQAAAKMQSHAIAVVDTGGHLVAALRMDGNGSGMMDFALAKAEAVAAWGFSTADMAAGAKDTPGFALAPTWSPSPAEFRSSGRRQGAARRRGRFGRGAGG